MCTGSRAAELWKGPRSSHSGRAEGFGCGTEPSLMCESGAVGSGPPALADGLSALSRGGWEWCMAGLHV